MNEMCAFLPTIGKIIAENRSNTSISIRYVLSGIKSQLLMSISMVAVMDCFANQVMAGKNVNFTRMSIRRAVVQN